MWFHGRIKIQKNVRQETFAFLISSAHTSEIR